MSAAPFLELGESFSCRLDRKKTFYQELAVRKNWIKNINEICISKIF